MRTYRISTWDFEDGHWDVYESGMTLWQLKRQLKRMRGAKRRHPCDRRPTPHGGCWDDCSLWVEREDRIGQIDDRDELRRERQEAFEERELANSKSPLFAGLED